MEVDARLPRGHDLQLFGDLCNTSSAVLDGWIWCIIIIHGRARYLNGRARPTAPCHLAKVTASEPESDTKAAVRKIWPQIGDERKIYTARWAGKQFARGGSVQVCLARLVRLAAHAHLFSRNARVGAAGCSRGRKASRRRCKRGFLLRSICKVPRDASPVSDRAKIVKSSQVICL